MKFVRDFKQFITEKKEKDFEDKIKGHGYYKGISTSTARAKEKQMKDQSSMADDNPDAYKELPGDTNGKKSLKKSKHTKAFDDLYAEGLEEMIINEGVMSELHIMMEEANEENKVDDTLDSQSRNVGIIRSLKSIKNI